MEKNITFIYNGDNRIPCIIINGKVLAYTAATRGISKVGSSISSCNCTECPDYDFTCSITGCPQTDIKPENYEIPEDGSSF